MEGEKSEIKLENILVAIDGSAIADYSLNLAIHIGEKYGSKIGVIYVAPTFTNVPSASMFDPMFGGAVMPPRPVESVASDAPGEKRKMEALLNERKQLVESHNLACETISANSEDVSGEIIRRSSQFDLVSVGSRGLSGLKSLILGSVSKKVAREAKSSVLVVKSRIDSIPKILLAYDGSEPAKKALLYASELGKKFSALVSVICVAGIPITPEGYVSADIDRWESEMRSFTEYAVSFLKSNGIKSDGKTVDSRDVSRTVVDEAVRGSYDLIVVGNRGYGRLKSLFLGSVASGVADSSKTNVLIVR
jgi:nucleotide-binding universal stress UspA family protein